MKVKDIGESFGAFGLTDGEVYECTEVDELTGALRIVTDPNDWNYNNDPDWKPGYLFSSVNPRPFSGQSPGGRFEIVEDDEKGTLAKAILQ
jgi:hypothetical protein